MEIIYLLSRRWIRSTIDNRVFQVKTLFLATAVVANLKTETLTNILSPCVSLCVCQRGQKTLQVCQKHEHKKERIQKGFYTHNPPSLHGQWGIETGSINATANLLFPKAEKCNNIHVNDFFKKSIIQISTICKDDNCESQAIKCWI